MTLWELFFAFLQVGLFSVGGGYAAIPLLESTVVRSHAWLTLSEFSDLVTIAEMTPGPIGINAATFVGMRIAGLPGALIASLGFVLPSLILVSLLFWLYRKYRTLPLLQRLMKTLRPVVVALIASAGVTLLRTAVFSDAALSLSAVSWLAVVLFTGAFAAIRFGKWNPILVMALCGGLYLGVSLFL